MLHTTPLLGSVPEAIFSRKTMPEYQEMLDLSIELNVCENYLFIYDYGEVPITWVSQVYRDQAQWTKMAIPNVARIGKFSSDRAIREYCRDIWKVEPVRIEG